jgi:hypothetical protein
VTSCPNCGEPAEPGQLVCVNCGTRLALEPARRSAGPLGGSLPVLAVLLAVVVLGAGAFGYALSEITSDDAGDDGEVASAGSGDQPAPSATPGEPQPPSQAERTEPKTETESDTAPPQEPRRRLLLEWPEGLTGHTVVLVTTSDRPAALRLARGAARSGIEAGLLRADDFDLGSDLWIVFAGRFDTRAGASRQAVNLAGRYPGAYPQLLEPVEG